MINLLCSHFPRSLWKDDKEVGQSDLRILEQLPWFFSAFAWIGKGASRSDSPLVFFWQVHVPEPQSLNSRWRNKLLFFWLASLRYFLAFLNLKRQSWFGPLIICSYIKILKSSITTEFVDTCRLDAIHCFLEIISIFINWRHTGAHFRF